jgi:transcriptional regulator with XRE-family HTH domain
MKFMINGDALRALRKKKKLSQEALCEDICSISTYSRFENGDQILDAGMIKRVMARLGYTDESYVCALLNTGDSKSFQSRLKVDKCIQTEQYEKIEIELKELRLAMSQNAAEKPYIDFCEGVIALGCTNDYKSAIQLFTKALKLTAGQYDYKDLKNLVLSSDELMINSYLAVAYYLNGEKIKSLKHFQDIQDVLKDEAIYCENSLLPVCMLFKLAKALNFDQNYSCSLNICDIALEECKKNNNSYKLIELLHLKAENIGELEGEEQKNKMQRLIKFIE